MSQLVECEFGFGENKSHIESINNSPMSTKRCIFSVREDEETDTHTDLHINSQNKGAYDVIVMMLFFLFSVLMNLRVFFIIVTSLPRKRLRPVSILVAHLSSVAICLTFVLFLYVVEKWNIVNLSASGYCEILSFFRNVVYNVFPLNVASIIYERIRSFRITLEQLLVYRTIFLIWVVAVVGSLPSVLMVKYEMDVSTNLGKCQQIPLLGEIGLTKAYELFRFLFYHVLVVGYMAYALFRIRSKIRYLYILKPIPNARMKKKVQRVRFVYLHSIVFMMLWLPSGFIVSLYKILSRKNSIFPPIKMYTTIIIVLTFTYVILCPIIYVCLNEDISIIHFCLGRFSFNRRKQQQANKVTGNELNTGANEDNTRTTVSIEVGNKKMNRRNKTMNGDPLTIEDSDLSENNSKHNRHDRELSEMSRFSTIAVTETSDALYPLPCVAKNWQVPANIGDSDDVPVLVSSLSNGENRVKTNTHDSSKSDTLVFVEVSVSVNAAVVSVSSGSKLETVV